VSPDITLGIDKGLNLLLKKFTHDHNMPGDAGSGLNYNSIKGQDYTNVEHWLHGWK
jgi:hypothetical protein